jgi:uncharacterized protein (TIGR02145 family)
MATKIYSFFVILSVSVSVWSQGVGVNETGNNPDASAILDASSTNKGFLPPRMTTLQRDAISNPATGLMVYNTSLFCLQVNDGTPTSPIWNCMSNGAGIPDGIITTLDCLESTSIGTLTHGQVASGVNSVISYTGGNGGVHGGQEVASMGVVGLTATLVPSTFASGSGSLTYTITGTPTTEGTAFFVIDIGGQSCTLTRTVESQPPHPQGYMHCNISNITSVVEVTNPITGAVWMDRNLGANRVATNPSDEQSFGSLFQWGRFADGHQCVQRYTGDGVITSGTTTTLSSINIPTHGNFIMSSSGNSDWRSPQNHNLWSGLNGDNNPCPIGFRVPTRFEWIDERSSWLQDPINSTNTSDGAFASPIKFSMAGMRNRGSGVIGNEGLSGLYWTSTIHSTNSWAIDINITSATMYAFHRAQGFSVRCIKEN